MLRQVMLARLSIGYVVELGYIDGLGGREFSVLSCVRGGTMQLDGWNGGSAPGMYRSK